MTKFDIDIEEYYPDQAAIPERNLMAAVLCRAIFDYCGDKEKIQRSAHSWIFGRYKKTSYFLTFEFICHTLGLDGNKIRETLKTKETRERLSLIRFRNI